MLNIEASRNISQDVFVKRNSAIYEGIEVDNMEIEVTAYDEERKAVTYQTSFTHFADSIFSITSGSISNNSAIC